MFYAVVNVLQVEEYVGFFEQDDNDILVAFLGDITGFIQTLNSDTWKDLSRT